MKYVNYIASFLGFLFFVMPFVLIGMAVGIVWTGIAFGYRAGKEDFDDFRAFCIDAQKAIRKPRATKGD